MKTSIASRIRPYAEMLWDLFLSAFGCFVLRRCFRLIAEGSDLQETVTNVVALGHARDPIAYMRAALILMALAANDQPGLMRAAPETLS